ncbi:hypothetical protein GQX74_009529 [Glossina fuscipes]|nr:hypothetical protein GQX74_009529 [Glossina fuscipes]
MISSTSKLKFMWIVLYIGCTATVRNSSSLKEGLFPKFYGNADAYGGNLNHHDSLEVFGIDSSFHIAQLQLGISKPFRLSQAKHVKECFQNSRKRKQRTRKVKRASLNLGQQVQPTGFRIEL